MRVTDDIWRKPPRSPWQLFPAIAVAAIVSALATLSCDDEPVVPPEPAPASITVTPATAELFARDDTVRLAAAVLDEDGNEMDGFPVSWSSDDVSIATVSDSGLVRAVGDGTATITATADSVSATAAVTVVVNLDRPALVALYEATDGDNWNRNYGWLTDAPLDEWHGLEVNDDGRVTELNMWGNDLSGPIPPEIAQLDMLERIRFEFNGLTGAIPPELGTLPNLRSLLLTSNRLTGPIPPTLAGLSELRDLRLSWNLLSGPIPPGIDGLTNLSTLNLLRNRITGPVPDDIDRLTNLAGLNLTDTEMSGPLPASLTELKGMTELLVGGTDLCGPDDEQFRVWLKGVRTQRVPPCAGVEDESTAYLTQVVQSRLFPVPLVADEEALLRVFVVAPDAEGKPIPPVQATFYVGGAEVEMVEFTPDSAFIRDEVDESSLASSANAVISASVIRPGLELVVEIDPDTTLDPDLGVARRIPETGRLKVDVREMPDMELTLIPFLYDEEPDSSILDITDELDAEDPLLWTVRTLLPVSEFALTIHDPVFTNSTNPAVLVGQTHAIRVAEEGRGYYMGTMAKSQADWAGAAPFGPAWVSFAVPDSVAMAHELGHNMGLLHAPCGRLTNADPAFPQRNGTIGAWGYDFTRGVLVAPSATDWMSYCDPVWASEFFYSNIVRYRHDIGGEESAPSHHAAGPSLLIRGGVDQEGAHYLDPAFVLGASAAFPRPAGPYSVTGVASDGAELFSLSFSMPEMADGDGSSSFAFVVPAQTSWGDRLARIRLTGPDGGSVSLDAETNRPAAILRTRQTGRIRGIYSDLPANMTRSDAMALLPGPGLETLFSRGLPDATEWFRR